MALRGIILLHVEPDCTSRDRFGRCAHRNGGVITKPRSVSIPEPQKTSSRGRKPRRLHSCVRCRHPIKTRS